MKNYLTPLNSVTSPSSTVVLFHHAGGHANFFFSWRNYFPTDVAVYAVQLPGRMNRIEEPFDSSVVVTAQNITTEIVNRINTSVYFFGHSLGGILAYACSCELQRRQWYNVQHLFISAAKTPQECKVMDTSVIGKDALRAYGGLPAELENDPEVLNFFLPVIRADFKLVVDFNAFVCEILDIGVTAIYGLDDTSTRIQQIVGWDEYCRYPLNLISFPGDHFYLKEYAEDLCHLIYPHC